MFLPTKRLLDVFSAHAEVVPRAAMSLGDSGSILRACGGSSHALNAVLGQIMYSPRMRR